jgi:hypothetical protein
MKINVTCMHVVSLCSVLGFFCNQTLVAAMPRMSYANVLKKTVPNKSSLAGINNLRKQPSKLTPEEQFERQLFAWARGKTAVVPNPISGKFFSIVFDDLCMNIGNIANGKLVLMLPKKAVAHVLNPMVTKDKFVDGGHFSNYLNKDVDEQYFFDNYTGKIVIPCSKLEIDSRIKAILWQSKDDCLSIKTAFDAHVTVYQVLTVAVNSPYELRTEKKNTYSLVIQKNKYLPCFKISFCAMDDGRFFITSIYPWAENFDAITSNMYAYH